MNQPAKTRLGKYKREVGQEGCMSLPGGPSKGKRAQSQPHKRGKKKQTTVMSYVGAIMNCWMNSRLDWISLHVLAFSDLMERASNCSTIFRQMMRGGIVAWSLLKTTPLCSSHMELIILAIRIVKAWQRLCLFTIMLIISMREKQHKKSTQVSRTSGQAESPPSLSYSGAREEEVVCRFIRLLAHRVLRVNAPKHSAFVSVVSVIE